MVKVKREMLLNQYFEKALTELYQQKLNKRHYMRISTIAMYLTKEKQAFYTFRDKYLVKDAEGKPVIENDQAKFTPEFEAALTEYMATEIEVPVNKLDHYSIGDNVQLSALDFDALSPFIDTKGFKG
jgi:hypothetical protein